MQEQDMLAISGIQHFAFCRRQWALIHIEGLWADNVRTVDGDIFHEHAHDDKFSEKRGNVLILRGLHVESKSLGIRGICDIVEFHLDPSGVSLHGREGLWLPFPVEYKRGSPKENNCDTLQLCAQAMCLEEMLVCPIHEGALYYGETHRRLNVIFTSEMRTQVQKTIHEMDNYILSFPPKKLSQMLM